MLSSSSRSVVLFSKGCSGTKTRYTLFDAGLIITNSGSRIRQFWLYTCSFIFFRISRMCWSKAMKEARLSGACKYSRREM